MATYDQVVTRWITIALGRETNTRQLRNDRMPIDGDRIFSYGSHFEIGRLIRDRNGKPLNWLLNGDVWGPTTGRHQSHVRSAVQRTGLPVVIIPFRALNAAGIDRDSVHILDVTHDRSVETEHVTYEQPPGSIIEWDKLTGRVELSPEALQAKCDEYNLEQYDNWAHNLGYAFEEMGESNPRYGRLYRDHLFEKCPTAITVDEWIARHPESSRYHITHDWRTVGHRLRCWTSGRRNDEWLMEYLPDGRTKYTRTTFRHWLGESLISGEIDYGVPRRCKWCRATGRAEGPVRGNWQPPEEETKWMPRGVFDPTTGVSIRVFGQFATGRILPGHWSDDRWSIPPCTACRGRGRWTESRTRRAKFLSGFDANEARRSYFFCELPPRCTATTVVDAYDALKPDAVRLAEQMGRNVHRQGDIFAIPLSTASRAQLRKMGARFERMGRLLDTNHAATDAAYMPDGTTIVRGVLHHVPANRQPDHARVKLGDGKQWYVIQKNTVPLAA